jgi:hypothetical protein
MPFQTIFPNTLSHLLIHPTDILLIHEYTGTCCHACETQHVLHAPGPPYTVSHLRRSLQCSLQAPINEGLATPLSITRGFPYFLTDCDNGCGLLGMTDINMGLTHALWFINKHSCIWLSLNKIQGKMRRSFWLSIAI